MPQGVHVGLPAAGEKVLAGQTPHTPLLVGVHGVPAPGEEPAGHETQLEHGAVPVVAFHETPATHAGLHTALALFQA